MHHVCWCRYSLGAAVLKGQCRRSSSATGYLNCTSTISYCGLNYQFSSWFSERGMPFLHGDTHTLYINIIAMLSNSKAKMHIHAHSWNQWLQHYDLHSAGLISTAALFLSWYFNTLLYVHVAGQEGTCLDHGTCKIWDKWGGLLYGIKATFTSLPHKIAKKQITIVGKKNEEAVFSSVL